MLFNSRSGNNALHTINDLFFPPVLKSEDLNSIDFEAHIGKAPFVLSSIAKLQVLILLHNVTFLQVQIHSTEIASASVMKSSTLQLHLLQACHLHQ